MIEGCEGEINEIGYWITSDQLRFFAKYDRDKKKQSALETKKQQLCDILVQFNKNTSSETAKNGKE